MNENFIIKILEYALHNLDKVYCSNDYLLYVKLDTDLIVEIATLYIISDTNGNEVQLAIHINNLISSETIKCTDKTYKLIQYKLLQIKDLFFEYQENRISDIISLDDNHIITNINDVYDD